MDGASTAMENGTAVPGDRDVMEPAGGFEPSTCGLRNRCSTSELHRLMEGFRFNAVLLRAFSLKIFSRLTTYSRTAATDGDTL